MTRVLYPALPKVFLNVSLKKYILFPAMTTIRLLRKFVLRKKLGREKNFFPFPARKSAK